MIVPFVASVASLADKGKGILDKIGKFITGLACKAQGSCKDNFNKAIAATGGTVGYRRRTRDGGEQWFLNTTESISWDDSAPNAMRTWYQVSGYWQKLKDAGLNPCCLKQTYPPAEAFPFAADGKLFDGWLTIRVGEFDVNVDKISYNPDVHQFTSTATSGGESKIADKGLQEAKADNLKNLLVLGGTFAALFFLPSILKKRG